MKRKRTPLRRILAAGLLTVLAGISSGCGQSPPARFHLNLVELKHIGIDPVADQRQLQGIATALEAMFGTPDEPFALPETGLDLEKLRQAAGPVGGTTGSRRGLYREHCVHCHGISGDGAGPTAAFLNPYPRDYRRGWYKFKSTEAATPPTMADLHKTLIQGIPGTAMPSFRLLPPDEMDAILEYVKYLSLRGQTELRLAATINEDWSSEALDTKGSDGKPLSDTDLAKRKKTQEENIKANDALLTDRENLIVKGLAKAVKEWDAAKNKIIKVPPKPTAKDDPEFELAKSIEIGRKLFYQVQSPKQAGGGCIQCHGPYAMGDDGQVRYDKWQENIKPDDYALGALPQRVIQPRNLRTGVFRGGRRPLDLYYRVYNGINGTPMPDGKAMGSPGVAADKHAADNAKLIWHIVDYVSNLPFEPESELSTAKDSDTVHRDNL